MGVPQFFHWLVTHYEKHLLREDYSSGGSSGVKPDYLYLDFNCGIHPAAKQEGIETLEEMYEAVCEYLMKVVKEAVPQKALFIAIDGVAPLAKMKQQRIRRFKVVQDKKELKRINARHKKKTDNRFDFNMISPGTEFMEQLSINLKKYIANQMKKKFPNLRVILSDASEPGEGEHKIMAHIRQFTDENDQIVVYGLDSDLIFLSLLHYRPNFCLLREKIFFGKSKETEGDSKFTFFDIGKFREILLAILTPEMSREELAATGLLTATSERRSDIPVINIEFFDDVDNTLLLDSDNENDKSKVDVKSQKQDPNCDLGFRGLLTSLDGGSSNSSLFKSSGDLNSDGSLSLGGSSEGRKNGGARGGRPLLLQSTELKRGRMASGKAVQLILDYVAVCFVLGNDFLPYLPSLKIKEGGLNRVLECYKMVQEELVGSHLVNKFSLDRDFLMKWLEYIVCYEETDLKQHTENREVRVSKFKKSYRYRTAEAYDRDLMEFEYIEDKCSDTLRMGHPYWQDRYYKYYLGTHQDDEILDRWVYNYLEGVLWTLRYYQGNGFGFSSGSGGGSGGSGGGSGGSGGSSSGSSGSSGSGSSGSGSGSGSSGSGSSGIGQMDERCCPDWGWQYHFRSAPPASLILEYLKKYPDFELNFKNSNPLKPVAPYEQLMMILPPQSGKLIHPKLVKLMKQVDSPLIYLYPTNFEIDMMRHRYRWECYPILPDIDMQLTRQVVGLVMSIERMPKTIWIEPSQKTHGLDGNDKLTQKKKSLKFKKTLNQ